VSPFRHIKSSPVPSKAPGLMLDIPREGTRRRVQCASGSGELDLQGGSGFKSCRRCKSTGVDPDAQQVSAALQKQCFKLCMRLIVARNSEQVTIGGRDFGGSDDVTSSQPPEEHNPELHQVVTVEEAMEENFEHERDKVMQELMDEVAYQQQLYSLAASAANKSNLWYTVPILMLGTFSAFGAFLSGTALIEDKNKPLVCVWTAH